MVLSSRLLHAIVIVMFLITRPLRASSKLTVALTPGELEVIESSASTRISASTVIQSALASAKWHRRATALLVVYHTKYCESDEP
jgi:hypothetical protein